MALIDLLFATSPRRAQRASVIETYDLKADEHLAGRWSRKMRAPLSGSTQMSNLHERALIRVRWRRGPAHRQETRGMDGVWRVRAWMAGPTGELDFDTSGRVSSTSGTARTGISVVDPGREHRGTCIRRRVRNRIAGVAVDLAKGLVYALRSTSRSHTSPIVVIGRQAPRIVVQSSVAVTAVLGSTVRHSRGRAYGVPAPLLRLGDLRGRHYRVDDRAGADDTTLEACSALRPRSTARGSSPSIGRHGL